MSSTNSNSFASFSIWIPFISFSTLITVSRTSQTMLNESGKSGHLCLDLDLNENVFSFLTWSMMLAAKEFHLSWMAFIMWGRFLLSPLSGKFFFFFFGHKWVLNPVSFFLHLLRWSYDFYLSFCSCVYHIDFFAYNKESLCSWYKSHLISMCDPFNVVFDLVCKYFIKDLLIYIYQWYWPVIVLIDFTHCFLTQTFKAIYFLPYTALTTSHQFWCVLFLLTFT